VLVATNRPSASGASASRPWRIGSRPAGRSPASIAALLASRHPHAFVAACDMPGLAPDVIRFLVGRIGAADAIVPAWEGDVEPLHAVYALRCVPAIEANLRAGRHALRELLPSLSVDYVSEAELRACAGGGQPDQREHARGAGGGRRTVR